MKKKVKFFVFLTFSIMILISGVIPAAGCGPRRRIYVIKDDPNDGKNITEHIWSSDGKKIAYIVCPDDRDLLYSACELWVADWKWGRLRNKQLIYTGIEWFGLEDWKSDWILFMMRHEVTPTAYNSTHTTRELWKIRSDGTDLTQVTFTYTNGIRTIFWPGHYDYHGTVSGGRFIPGTDLIAFSAHDGNGWYKLYVCNDDGTDNWYRVSSEYAFTWAMSPTGNKLVWGHAWGWNAPTTLYSADIYGSNKVLVKSSSYYRLAPLILADGNTLIFRYVGSGWYPDVPATLEGNIYAIDLDGTNERTILDDEYLNYHESYDPVNEQALLMRSNRSEDGNMHIYKVNVDGTGIVQLTRGPYNDEAAMYSPNGRYIMYRRLPEDYVKDASDLPYPYDLVIVRVWRWHGHCWSHWHHRYCIRHCSKMGKRG